MGKHVKGYGKEYTEGVRKKKEECLLNCSFLVRMDFYPPSTSHEEVNYGNCFC